MNTLKLSVCAFLAYALFAGLFSLTTPRSVGAQGTQGPTVRIGNTTSTPVPITAAFAEPYQASVVEAIPAGLFGGLIELPAVPVGKRLVIEYVSITGAVPIGQQVIGRIGTRLSSNGFAHVIGLSSKSTETIAGGWDTYVGNERVLIFVNGGEVPQILVTRSNSSGQWRVLGSVSGYLLDVPEPQ